MAKDNFGASLMSQQHNDTYPLIDPTNADLSGKYVFISGVSKGIGKALAISYAQAGAAGIALGARSDLSSLENEVLDAAKKANRKEPKILKLWLDVTALDSTQAAAKATECAFGKLDILINNAGYLASWAKMTEADPDEWWKTWEVNVKGIFYVKRAFIPLMLKGGDKTIINVTSIGALHVHPGASSYQPSKLAVCRLTEFACEEFGEEGLLCYCVHPGGVPTELAHNMPKAMHTLLVDTAELAADTMVFLTAEKRDWLAGRYLSCTWDMGQLLQRKDEIAKSESLKIRLLV